jgi:GT2 family glycosyltransferase
MLNPDTLLVEDAVDALVAFMRRTPKCAAAGPQLLGADGNDQCGAQRFPSVRGELKKTMGRLFRGTVPTLEDYQTCVNLGVAFEADWVSGACMLMRTEVVRTVGVLEKRFFMYFEEVDWCRRAADAGWETWCLPQHSVIHFGSQSALASRERLVGGNVLRHFQRSRYIYFKKHFGLPAAWFVECCHFARVCLRLFKSFGGKTREECRSGRASAYAELAGELSLILGLART